MQCSVDWLSATYLCNTINIISSKTDGKRRIDDLVDNTLSSYFKHIILTTKLVKSIVFRFSNQRLFYE